MAQTSPTDLPDPFDPSSAEARHRALAQLRARGGVHRLPTGSWVAVSHAAVETGLKSIDCFAGTFGDQGQLPDEKRIMAAIPEPKHGQLRRILNSVFAYHHAVKLEPVIRQIAAGLLDELLRAGAQRRSVCLMEQLARPLPSAVIAHVLGVPPRDFVRFARWSDEVLALQGEQDRANAALADLHPELAAYARAQMEARLRDPEAPDDLTTRLLRAEIGGARLSPTAVLTQMIFLIVAGNETTRNLIGNLLLRVVGDAPLYERVRADRALVKPLIEETLRLDSPVQLLARTCTQAIELDGVAIAEGERVLFSLASANRDETYFEDPTAFRLDRARPREHLAFGAGPHVCPGAFLARMEARIALEALLDRVERVAFAPGYAFDPNPVFWALGPRTLQAVIEAA